MSEKAKVRLIKYGLSGLLVALLAWAYISSRDMANAQIVDWCLVLCDAFTVPGMILLMLGCLIWLSTQGALDGITYCLRYVAYTLIPGKRLEKEEKYGDYVLRKRGNRITGYGFLLISGAVTMVIALIFYALFYYYYL